MIPIPSSEITPEHVYLNRRQFLHTATASLAALIAPGVLLKARPARAALARRAAGCRGRGQRPVRRLRAAPRLGRAGGQSHGRRNWRRRGDTHGCRPERSRGLPRERALGTLGRRGSRLARPGVSGRRLHPLLLRRTSRGGLMRTEFDAVVVGVAAVTAPRRLPVVPGVNPPVISWGYSSSWQDCSYCTLGDRPFLW